MGKKKKSSPQKPPERFFGFDDDEDDIRAARPGVFKFGGVRAGAGFGARGSGTGGLAAQQVSIRNNPPSGRARHSGGGGNR